MVLQSIKVITGSYMKRGITVFFSIFSCIIADNFVKEDRDNPLYTSSGEVELNLNNIEVYAAVQKKEKKGIYEKGFLVFSDFIRASLIYKVKEERTVLALALLTAMLLILK